MRARLLIRPAVVVLAVAMAPAEAAAQETGGVPAPAGSGGARYGDVPPLRRPQPLRVSSFRVSPNRIAADARSVRLSFRVEGGAPRVLVRFSLAPVAGDRPLRSVVWRARPGRRYTRQVGLPAARLAAGSY